MPFNPSFFRRHTVALLLLLLLAMSLVCALAHAQDPVFNFDSLPRPTTPPPEKGPVVPAQVDRWRREAEALEHGVDGSARDPVLAAQLYCRAARYGDAVAQYNLAWMLTNPRGIERDDAQAAHLFAAAAEQGLAVAANMARVMGTPQGPPPACLRPPDSDPAPLLAAAQRAKLKPNLLLHLPPPANAPPQIVQFVNLIAPDYKLAPHLVLALMAAESNFDTQAQSPKNAQGLMQLIPETAFRFKVKKLSDPVQNMKGGMAYLRWLLAYYEGDIALALAAYNAGEGAVDRYRGVPPYAETRLYVRRIIAAIGGQREHPFDASVTPPSAMLALGRLPAVKR